MAEERGIFEDDIRGKNAKEVSRRYLPRGKRIPQRVGQLHRNTRNNPEVVVKVSSYTKDRGRAIAHAKYVTRRDKEGVEDLPAEMADGSLLSEPEEVDEVIDSWFAAPEKRKDARRTVNIVLSSPAHSDVEKVKQAVREFASDFFGNHDYMFVTHTDTKNPHAHLTVKTRDFDGQQLRLGKDRLQIMRELYAQKLREQGIDVNASYRTERAQWRKSKSQALHHLDKPNAEKPRESRVSAARKRSAELGADSVKDQPWRSAMQAKRDAMNAEYRGAAKYLRQTFGDEFEAQAQALEEFGDQLPKPKTLSDEIAEQLHAQKQQQDRQPDAGRDGLQR